MSSSIGILTKTFFTLDYRDKDNSGKKKFIGIILSYLFANFVLSINNFIAFDKDSFIFLSFSNGLFLLVFIALNDFGELLFVKRHREIISSLPVSNTALVSAKLISAFLFLAVYALIIIIPQVVLFSLYNTGFWEIVFFIKANFVSMFFVLGVIIFIYTVSYKLFAKKSNFILYFLQFVFFFYVITVSSLASRQALGKSGILNFDFVYFLPQYYFSLSVHNPLLLLGLFLLTLLVYMLYFSYFRKNYTKISSVIYGAIETSNSRKNKFNIFAGYNNFISSYFVKNEEEKASYYLTLNQLRNSRTLKLKFIPLTFLPVVVGIIALFTDSYKFVSNNGEAGSILILTPSVTFVVIMCFRLLVTATKIEDENSPGVGWIYSALPVGSIKRLQNANIKFVFVNFIIPVSVILFVILSFKFQVLHLLLNMLYLLSASFMINTIFLMTDKVFPYSLESTKYNSASKLGEILFIMLIGVAIFIAQIFIFENVIFVIIAVLLFYVISYLMKQKSFTLK
jgi:hypothetical protein